ncbi:MAG TPA: aromatic ring-hydroxylating dioxygenase subunit alpha [Chthoniobacterales bacterium]|jgi:Rieske 2Fe-2S family protein
MKPDVVFESNPAFRKTTDSYKSGATTLPQRYFAWPEVFAEERKKIFARRWICLGHISELPNTGDYIVREVAGESVIVVRNQKGALNSYYNVCRHRGTRLCETPQGHSMTLQCPYHAWTYNLDGELIGAPQMETVDHFAKSQYPLRSVEIDSFEGLIFVSLADSPTPLPRVFAPLLGKFAHWNLPLLHSARQIEYSVRANWKLIFENYSECYHCPLVHPALSRISPSDSAENDLVEGPFLGGFMRIAQGKSLTLSGNACALSVGELEAQDHARVFYYSIFPNLLLSLHPDYVMVHQLFPLAPDRTRIVCNWFFHPQAFGRSDFHPEDGIDFWDMTNRQDWHVCELSQLGISSRAYQPGPYSARESIPAAWDREYLRHVE